ncbi:hypothetical protein [Microcoleus sp. FACHB-672]|uniref:hypothetical protein n=1 Tax=Microcoleus sp. FACHB-672 TaxID=2692825 RepID=UPI001687F42B|nr:hypothetical protein [Microcoleus sp. FACHB-672]MBD2043027.1 hypothetical protein [Microcoleus sp. FACHB-672]
MGFPIKSNIFNAGSPSQRYFARFPIQVAILFKPNDTSFTEYLKAEFAGLDRNTGENLAFFAVLDPPDEWLQEHYNSRWWQTYQQTAGRSSFTTNERPLMLEIARLFGLPWHSLPAIVVSTNLWQVEHVSCPTSSKHLDIQLNELARLPKIYGVPNIGHIVTTLEAICGDQVDYHPPNESSRERLRTFYNILNTFAPERGLEGTDYRYELGRQLDVVENSLDLLRRNSRFQQFEEPDFAEIGSVDAVIEDVAGRLIAPASVAARVLQDLQNSVELPELLHDESAAMIETSLLVGSFLENLAENSLGGLGPLGRRQPQGGYGQNPARRRTNQMLDIDFTPSAQGAWKAFELEVNLSMIQAARAARDIAMPTYFTLYDPALPPQRGTVETGRRRSRVITVDINQLDWSDRSSGRHRFISLGDALYLVRAMIDSPKENLDLVIQKAIGKSLPERVLDAWEEIFRVRNRGSHVHRLDRQDYERVLELALAPDVLRPLLKIKDAILQGRIL